MAGERLLEKAAGPRSVCCLVHDPPQRMQRLERIGVIGTDQAALLRQRLLQRLARWRVLAPLMSE